MLAATSAVLELQPLSAAAVASLSGEGADDVYATTGGNPFYVTELLASRSADELPRSITNAVRGRASRLSGEERRLVELVSVVPNRVATSVPTRSALAGAGRGAGAPALLAVDPRYVRFRHSSPATPSGRASRSRRGAGYTPRSWPRC